MRRSINAFGLARQLNEFREARTAVGRSMSAITRERAFALSLSLAFRRRFLFDLSGRLSAPAGEMGHPDRIKRHETDKPERAAQVQPDQRACGKPESRKPEVDCSALFRRGEPGHTVGTIDQPPGYPTVCPDGLRAYVRR